MVFTLKPAQHFNFMSDKLVYVDQLQEKHGVSESTTKLTEDWGQKLEFLAKFLQSLSEHIAKCDVLRQTDSEADLLGNKSKAEDLQKESLGHDHALKIVIRDMKKAFPL